MSRNCLALGHKEQAAPNAPQPKGIGLIKVETHAGTDLGEDDFDACFKTLVFSGFVSLTGKANEKKILCNSCAMP